ncbi:uncharacterized protein DUF4232 [Rathayibacter tanaceti]|uniref:Uncharacterized protein DUF4232 n=2 Tax=Rathayibacter tanaceti TaxID=1671680 RepID=A0ACD2XIF2_9MICO|nr:DUF4232 domain-containing protein [Rathayibacter tanaceti]QHC55230.1 DUF4232 domain-containing protein [Rathayibacter tanaceti]TCO36478.1 uncharacterized protein DUF4232 [Rathayibacter tanaceti]
MSMSTRRIAAPVLAAASLVLLLSGCAGGGGAATSQSPLPRPSATRTPDVPTRTPSAAAPTAAPTPTAAPAPEQTAPDAPPVSAPDSPDQSPAESSTPRCNGSDLAMEYRPDPEASGAGSSAFDLVLTNTASEPCTLTGIPGVYATDAGGARISAVAEASGPNPDTLIALAPGARADVRLAWHSPGANGCAAATSAYLVAEVRDAADGAVRAPAEIEVCTDGTVMMEASTYTLL